MPQRIVEVKIARPPLDPQFEATMSALVDSRFMSRLWEKDASLFGDQPDLKAIVANRLGWLDSPGWLESHVEELAEFALDIQVAGFCHVVLLGMGGSSLCPEVLAHVFGLPAYLESFDIVDATDPATIARIESAVDLKKTLFIVASKSGSTTETRSQAAYFLERVGKEMAEPGNQFVAITDPESSLHRWAERDHFRRVFLNPADIGGRYSALSYFGMVPAALLQVPLSKFTEGTIQMAAELHADDASNAALQLGAQMALLALAERDKLTFITNDRASHVVPWIEQLIAESTGKEQRGVIPIEGEPEGLLEQYGADRVFVRMYIGASTISTLAGSVDAEIDIQVPEAINTGALFLLWEAAVSVAGRVLDINPFDEPNVQESKDNTRRLLDAFHIAGSFKETGRKVSGDSCDVWSLGTDGDDLGSLCHSFTTNMNPGDYCALLYFGDRTPVAEQWLAGLRSHLRNTRGVATLRGYGPRYLHSIGQLYKGGKQNGHFIVFTTDGTEDRIIPGETHPFSALLRAQALGDVEALSSRGRPVLHVHLKGDDAGARHAFSSAWCVNSIATT